MTWSDYVTFLVHEGRKVIVDPQPQIEEQIVRNLFLGPVLGVALNQRGLHLFHASVVRLAGNAVAILAPKGWGKSTLAAILHSRGHTVLCDDIAALEQGKQQPLIQPGFPMLKLWADTVRAIGHNPEEYPRLHPQLEKHIYDLGSGFSSTPQPLRAVLVMQPGDKPIVVPLSGKEALFQILPHWYGTLYNGDLLPIFGSQNHLRECALLAKHVPVYGLRLPRSLTGAQKAAQFLETLDWL